MKPTESDWIDPGFVDDNSSIPNFTLPEDPDSISQQDKHSITRFDTVDGSNTTDYGAASTFIPRFSRIVSVPISANQQNSLQERQVQTDEPHPWDIQPYWKRSGRNHCILSILVFAVVVFVAAGAGILVREEVEVEEDVDNMLNENLASFCGSFEEDQAIREFVADFFADVVAQTNENEPLIVSFRRNSLSCLPSNMFAAVSGPDAAQLEKLAELVLFQVGLRNISETAFNSSLSNLTRFLI